MNCKKLSSIEDLSNWKISNVTNMQNLFNGCSSIKEIRGISEWDTSNVEYMNGVFRGCKKLSTKYIFYFDLIIEFYTQKFFNEKFPFIIPDDIFEKIILLGKFGQSMLNRKLCCYLSSCLCRLYKNNNNENSQKLFNRICFLFCDS